MIRKILDFCIHERLVILVASVALIAYGWHSTREVPLDAIPNVGENQVIVLSEWMGRSPKDVEDQITYPLSVAMQAVPGAESVRGKSMFGFSFVQVTFADDVDFYWARSRVSEQLTTVSNILPDSVTPTLGPDATGLGQIYYYVLENIYGGLADGEAEGSPGGPAQRLKVIRESAAEVVPAVITAVSTTIISFLPAMHQEDRGRPPNAPAGNRPILSDLVACQADTSVELFQNRSRASLGIGKHRLPEIVGDGV